ncbi:hypothetical protein [Streptomyces sp. NPDC048392]
MRPTLPTLLGCARSRARTDDGTGAAAAALIVAGVENRAATGPVRGGGR